MKTKLSSVFFLSVCLSVCQSLLLRLSFFFTVLFKTDKVALNNFVECRINEQSGCISNVMYLV